VNQVKSAFGDLADDEFEARYKFSRPKPDLTGTPVVITCRSTRVFDKHFKFKLLLLIGVE
jgi:hypothetical protein